MQCRVAFLQFGTNGPALLTVGKSPYLIIGARDQLRHGDGFAVVINRHHGKEAAVAMANQLVADVLGNHLDADLHGGAAGIVHAGQKGDQLANLDGLEGSTPLLRTFLKRGTLCQRSVHVQTQKI